MVAHKPNFKKKSYLSLKDKLIDNIIIYVLYAVLIERLFKIIKVFC